MRSTRAPIRVHDRVLNLNQGKFFIVSEGVAHKPAAEGEAHVLLLEPISTLNTGNVRNDRTIEGYVTGSGSDRLTRPPSGSSSTSRTPGASSGG